MSRSFKSEPARKAAQQRREARRNARHSNVEWSDKTYESNTPHRDRPSHMVKK